MKTAKVFASVIIFSIMLLVGTASANFSDRPHPAPALGSVFSPADACGDTYEPNDTAATSVQAQVGSTMRAYICVSGDNDWFHFDVVAGQIIEIDLTHLTIDDDLGLYDPDGNLVKFASNSGTTDEHIAYTASKTGRYLARVSAKNGAFDPSTDGYYYLKIDVITPMCGDAYESNDSFSDPYWLSSTPATIDAFICVADDEDWFAFHVTVGQEITVDLSNLPADYDLYLTGPDFVDKAESKHSGTADEHILFTATNTGQYRVQVVGYNNAYDAAHPYRLHISLADPPPSTCGDVYEPNETFAAAFAISPPDTLEAYICTDSDEDYFKFNVAAGQEIDLWLAQLPADFDLYLYDPANTQVAQSRESGTTDERILYTATTSGWFRALVIGYNHLYDASDSYSLRVMLNGDATPGKTYMPIIWR